MRQHDIKLGSRRHTISPGEDFLITLPQAQVVRFYAADGDFSVSFNGGGFIPMTKGKKLAFPAESVVALKLRNEHHSDNAIGFYYGNVDIEDDTLNVVGLEQVEIAGSIQEIIAPVKTEPIGGAVDLGGAEYSTDANQISGKRWCRIKNTDGSVNISIGFGGLIITLLPGATWESPLLGRGETLSAITINAAGSSADVEWLN